TYGASYLVKSPRRPSALASFHRAYGARVFFVLKCTSCLHFLASCFLASCFLSSLLPCPPGLRAPAPQIPRSQRVAARPHVAGAVRRFSALDVPPHSQ